MSKTYYLCKSIYTEKTIIVSAESVEDAISRAREIEDDDPEDIAIDFDICCDTGWLVKSEEDE